jgi:hypothetical protein
MGSGRVAAGDDKVCSDMSLVAEEMLLEQGHAGDDARFAAGGKGMKFELGGDEGGGEFGVSGSSSTGTPNLWGDVMELFAVLVGDDGTGRRASVGGDLDEGG